ncbi:phosphatidylinositol-4,5-diphosphate 3-kinase [Pelomyxa schiedti]|nr:phosphatidylinositol-4,5-diphosphate 3-kinase [Pelomyxa schiedti]
MADKLNELFHEYVAAKEVERAARSKSKKAQEALLAFLDQYKGPLDPSIQHTVSRLHKSHKAPPPPPPPPPPPDEEEDQPPPPPPPDGEVNESASTIEEDVDGGPASATKSSSSKAMRTLGLDGVPPLSRSTSFTDSTHNNSVKSNPRREHSRSIMGPPSPSLADSDRKAARKSLVLSRKDDESLSNLLSMSGSAGSTPTTLLPPPSTARVTFEDRNTASSSANYVVRIEPDMTVDQLRTQICKRFDVDPRDYIVTTESRLTCPLDLTLVELSLVNPCVCRLKSVTEENDDLVLRGSDFTLKSSTTEQTPQKANTSVKIISKNISGERKEFIYPIERTIQQIIESTIADCGHDPSSKYCLTIKEINLWMGASYKTYVMKELPLYQACLGVGVNPTFEMCQEPNYMCETPPECAERMAESIKKESNLELIGDSYKITLNKFKEEVNDIRGEFARIRLSGRSTSSVTTRSFESKSVYILSEPPLIDPRMTLFFLVHIPGMTSKFSLKADAPVIELQKLVFTKLIKSNTTLTKTIDDFVLKVYGFNEYIVTTGDNGEPLTFNMFDYVRRCVAKKVQFLEFSFVEKLVPAPPTPQEFDANMLIDQLLAREVSKELVNAGPTIKTSSLDRKFKAKILSTLNLKWPITYDDKGKQNPVPSVYNIYATASLYHGGSPIAQQIFTPVVTYQDTCCHYLGWGLFTPFSISIKCIPKEARICFGVFATQETVGTTPTRIDSKDVALGWFGCQLYNHKLELISGRHRYKMWEGAPNPIGTCVENTISANPALIEVEFEQFRNRVVFSLPDTEGTPDVCPPLDPSQLRLLKDIFHLDPLVSLSKEARALLWQTRESHKSKPRALPKLLRSADWNNPSHVVTAHKLLLSWPLLKPTHALELLDARFADEDARKYAVNCLSGLTDAEVSDFLLQLTQVLKYERSHDSCLARFLLQRALANTNKIGHMFYWCLRAEMHIDTISERYGVLLEAFIRASGTYKEEIVKQHNLLKELETTAKLLKVTPKENRLSMLRQNLSRIVFPGPIQLPIDPRFTVNGLILENCKYMDSKKLPLWLAFQNYEPGAPTIYILFKEGDDLRQDILTLQMIRLMDSMWRKQNMDLRMQPYRCVATGDGIGMIEIVLNSTTNANINKKAGGTTAILNDSTMDEWLHANNPTPGAYKEAVENFLLSCAGYCVATYVLGIGDRHADNVMITKRGQFFHIDFGHFLGHVKSKFGVKRERAPFKFTPQYAYILGGKESAMFREFTETCCNAYSLLRTETDLFISLFSLMLSTGIPELQSEADIEYLRSALGVNLDNLQATEKFTQLINESLSAKSQTLNDIAHGLAHRS